MTGIDALGHIKRNSSIEGCVRVFLADEDSLQCVFPAMHSLQRILMIDLSESLASLGRRAECLQCLRAKSACICHWITPISPVTEVLILQHPMETRHAKGSARLLHLSLTGSRLAVGEVFSQAQLHALLYDPFLNVETDVTLGPTERRQPLLLYPETAAQGSPELLRTAVVPADADKLRLVVLDGTWRKSRKMLYLNPLLQELPRLALQAVAPSQYRIRKAHGPDQLSTLEATCHALAQLEQNGARYSRLLSSFNAFVAEQLRYKD